MHLYTHTNGLIHTLTLYFVCFNVYFSLWEILQTLYFATYGLIDIKHFMLQDKHYFTEFVGKTMFGCYCLSMNIVLLNMLIAMLNSSYQNTSVSIIELS